MELSLLPDRTLLPLGAPTTRLLVLRVDAPDVTDGARRAPVDLALVLDRSGSMRGEKLSLARAAVQDALRRLHADDGVSVIAFDDEAATVVPHTRATANAVAQAHAAVDRLDAGGSTNLLGAWSLAIDGLVRPGVEPADLAGRARRVVLLTDGRVNAGERDPARMRDAIAAGASQGIVTSALGLGDDFDETLLHDLASAGGGGFVYIPGADAIPLAVAREVGEALEVVARGASLTLELPEGGDVEVLTTMQHTREGRRLRVSLPDLTARQQLDVPLLLSLPAGAAPMPIRATLTCTASDGAFTTVTADLAFVPSPDADAERSDPNVRRAVAERIDALARVEATRRNRAGRYEDATLALHAAAARLRVLFPDDPGVRALVEALVRDAQRFGERMDARLLKQSMYRSSSVLSDRTHEGTSRKRGH
jgi:Ca-activated chloride channel family protein